MSDPNSSPIAAQRQLDAFVAIVTHAVSAARQNARPVDNNSVLVDRTGKSYKDEGTSSITANRCKLTGPVGPGVVVNP